MADNNNKDTIYVDIDDEITVLIDKVKASGGKVVALVLPKRATVLQSIVNMKLLKRTAESEKKNLVLITTESGLLPLAGAVGLHVAKTLTSKPEIPPGPNMAGSGMPETIDEDMSLPLDDEDELPDLAKSAAAGATVGSLADSLPKKAVGGQTSKLDNLETLELDDEEEPEPEPDTKAQEAASGAAAAAAGAATAKATKDKKVKVPNFNRFRTILIISVLLIIALVVLGVLAFSVLPHAEINIKTDASNVNTNLNLTLDTQTQTADLTSGDIPAKQVSEQKTFTQTVNTTGQKNEGTNASGSVTMTAQDCSGAYQGSPNFTIPSGTGISYNNLTYITQSDTSMNATKYDFKNNCVDYTASGSTNIAAQSPGTSYNTQINNATVSGYPEVMATGQASGGTDQIVQTVAQADITTATSKISSNDASTVKQDLINELKGENLYPVEVTFASGSPQISSNPSVGATANTVTVTETITYTMFGANQSDINKALDANIQSQTTKNQNIISNGLNQNAFKQVSATANADSVTLATLAEVGPNISVAGIKQQSAGKSPQQVISQLKSNPDVTNVTVRLSPFWVTKVPTNQSKITVKVAKPTKSA